MVLRFQLTLDDDIELFEGLYDRYRNARRVKVQLAPANLHWCSDAALARLADCSRKYGVPLHMHLLETAYQKEYARRRGGCTAVEYIDRFGLLGPQMTLGHGVWLNERDIDRLAETGTYVCHNCSSNFRLRSGVAALNKLEAAGHHHRDRDRRSGHQRRPRHAAGDADGAARASGARHGR
jgi:5-methylthioadenosine/S-adenosylhomocysteine deaminase